MLIGKVLRSPLPHANIKSIDVSKAAALPGVHAVLTYKDVTDATWGIPVHMKLLDKKVRFVGDAVALVAADTAEIADEAVELIKVEYEPLQACYNVEEALQPDQPQLYDQYPNNIIPQITKLLQNVIKGDVDKGFAEADEIIEGTGFYECFPNPLPPEPPGVVAYWENPDKLVAYVACSIAWSEQIPGTTFLPYGRRAIYRHAVRRQLRHQECQYDANRFCGRTIEGNQTTGQDLLHKRGALRCLLNTTFMPH